MSEAFEEEIRHIIEIIASPDCDRRAARKRFDLLRCKVLRELDFDEVLPGLTSKNLDKRYLSLKTLMCKKDRRAIGPLIAALPSFDVYDREMLITAMSGSA